LREESKKVFISCGEISGEIHARNLSRQFIENGFEVYGIGGKGLEDIGVILVEDVVSKSTIGFFEAIKNIYFFKKLLKKIEKLFDKEKFLCVILVDFWGFNKFVGRVAKKYGLPVFYYISPQVWASRERRIIVMKKWVKKIYVAFPFEVEIYKRYGVDVRFFGHPLLDVLPEEGEFSLEKLRIGIMPGSRNQEIRKLLPLFLKICERIRKDFKNSEFYLFKVKGIDYSSFKIPDCINVVYDNDYETRRKLNFCLCASGTATLENALLGIPMVIVYRVSLLTYFIARMIVKVKFIGMPNILAGREIVPEFVQDIDENKIYEKVYEILSKRDKILNMRKELLSLRKNLGTSGVARRVFEDMMRSL